MTFELPIEMSNALKDFSKKWGVDEREAFRRLFGLGSFIIS